MLKLADDVRDLRLRLVTNSCFHLVDRAHQLAIICDALCPVNLLRLHILHASLISQSHLPLLLLLEFTLGSLRVPLPVFLDDLLLGLDYHLGAALGFLHIVHVVIHLIRLDLPPLTPLSERVDLLGVTLTVDTLASFFIRGVNRYLVFLLLHLSFALFATFVFIFSFLAARLRHFDIGGGCNTTSHRVDNLGSHRLGVIPLTFVL